MQTEERTLKRAHSGEEGVAAKAKKQKASASTGNTAAHSSELNVHDVPGAKWHHHHKYNTRLQEEIEGPLPGDGTSIASTEAEFLPTPSTSALNSHTRLVSPQQKNMRSTPNKVFTPSANAATPTHESTRERHAETLPKVSRMGSFKVLVVALVFFASGFFSSLVHSRFGDCLFYDKKHGGLETKLKICRDIASEYTKGPFGLEKGDHVLFHPPLDSILGESSLEQIHWLHRVQAARNNGAEQEDEDQAFESVVKKYWGKLVSPC